MQINKQITKHRRSKGLTQRALADRLGVTVQAVSKWETSKCCPDIQLLPELAKIFDITVDELLGCNLVI